MSQKISIRRRARKRHNCLRTSLRTNPFKLPGRSLRDSGWVQRPKRKQMSTAVEHADVPSEFGRGLSACINCRLVKTFDQFYHNGCENCEAFLRLEGDQDRCSECTTPHFQGLISFIDPPTSWTAKWTHSARFAPGVYALSVQAAVPEHIEEILVDNKVAWYKRSS